MILDLSRRMQILILAWATSLDVPLMGSPNTAINVENNEQKLSGIPVQIGWQVPLSREVAFTLEVARDAGFSQIVLSTQVRGTGHLWVAPGEGVYHWRLGKADKKGWGGEVMSTVSGSFVALDPTTERSEPARISWGGVKEADQYKIFMFDQDGRTRISTTKDLFVLIHPNLKVTMVEVIPQKGAMSVQKSYHFLPTLYFKTPPPPKAKVAIASSSHPITQKQGAQDPEQKSEFSPSQHLPTTHESIGEADRPIHRISIHGILLTETLTLNKLDLSLSNTFKSGGGAISVWTSPVHGLVVTLDGMGWETVGELERSPSQIAEGGVALNPSISTTRFLGRVGIGYDVMSLWDITAASVSLGIVGASASYPMLPRIYVTPQAEPYDDPELKDEVVTMGGGSLGFFWSNQTVGILGDGFLLVDADRNHRISGQSLVTEFYPYKSLALQIGVWAQQGQWVLCDTDPTLCLSEGKVSTTSKVVGALVGGGLLLK